MFHSVRDIDDSVFNLVYPVSVPLLSKVAATGDLKKLRKMLLRGSLPQTPDNRGWTSIHWCVAANQIKALKLILKIKRKSRKFLVNSKTWEEITPLMIAVKAENPSLEMVALLLKAGADPKHHTHTRLTPLHLACLNKCSVDYVKLLVQFGANVNIQEELSLFTPLHFAVCKRCDLEVIKFLIDLSDLSLANVYKRTPFLEACNSNFTEAVQLFLEADKDLANVKSNLHPLIYAGYLGNLKMTQLLLESGVDVNCRCRAMVSHKICGSDFMLFDSNNFLPIYSSFQNIKVFMLLLKLTKWDKLLEVSGDYHSFPLFVLIHADEIFFEHLLQSGLPNKLKTFDSQVLVKFIIEYPDLERLVAKKFHTIFKYNFNLTPEKVFQSFADQINEEVLPDILRYLHTLATMGISSVNAFQSKSIIMRFLEEVLMESKDSQALALSQRTHDLLSVAVLTLRQLCRITVRDQIISSVKSNWLALKMIRESRLPDSLKRFLLFESPNKSL